MIRSQFIDWFNTSRHTLHCCHPWATGDCERYFKWQFLQQSFSFAKAKVLTKRCTYVHQRPPRSAPMVGCLRHLDVSPMMLGELQFVHRYLATMDHEDFLYAERNSGLRIGRLMPWCEVCTGACMARISPKSKVHRQAISIPARAMLQSRRGPAYNKRI